MPRAFRAESKGRPGGAVRVAAMAVVLGLFGAAAPVAADDLVTNLSNIGAGARKLSEEEMAQAFTTGPNVTGYQLESVSLHFTNGSTDPVYVYLHEDNGSGRPNHNNGGQVADLTRNGISFLSPSSGVNKYRVWKARCYPQPPHGGGCISDASSAYLAPNSTYWVYVWAGHDSTTARVSYSAQSTETGASGWSIADTAIMRPEGSPYNNYAATPTSMFLKVEGTTNPEVLVSSNDPTATEGTDETIDFVVSLNQATSGPVQVSYETFNLFGSSPADEGSDYEATSGTLTFRPR